MQFSDTGLMFLFMLGGPSIAALLMCTILDREGGLRELLARMGRWRVPLRWCGVLLLTIAGLAIVVLILLAVAVSPVFAPGFAGIGIRLLHPFYSGSQIALGPVTSPEDDLLRHTMFSVVLVAVAAIVVARNRNQEPWTAAHKYSKMISGNQPNLSQGVRS